MTLNSTTSLLLSSSTTMDSPADDQLPAETIRISDLTFLRNPAEPATLVVQWDLYPSLIDQSLNDEARRNYFRRHDINGFKISSSSPVYQISELLDVLRRNYTFENLHQGEICLYLLRKINYEKYCKQVQASSMPLPIEETKSSIVIERVTSAWYLHEPTKSILIGSIFGILLVLILLILISILISRCPYLFICHLRSRKYHQNNDSKSESLLVRPTPTNTNPWSAVVPSLPSSQHHFYHPSSHSTRPVSYQPSLSTQCTCPTHYQSSNSSTSETNSPAGNPMGTYHIYQEILNDDYATQTYRTSRPLHIDTRPPPTSIPINRTGNSEQCQLCSLSVLV